nr:TetR/AcrR family transcriptional regulator [uncultured Roseateles sp.]
MSDLSVLPPLTDKPTPRRRRGAAQDELREQIRQAVKQQHNAGGYGAVTMRGVAQAVGISAMSLYRYFPNKSAMLESIWAEALEASLQSAIQGSAAASEPWARLRQLYEAYANFWLTHPDDFKLVFDPCNEVSANFLASGPAAGFRQQYESMIDACLGEGLSLAQRQQCHDLCRLKIVGLLFTTVGLATKPATPVATLLQLTLDDIEQQLMRIKKGG